MMPTNPILIGLETNEFHFNEDNVFATNELYLSHRITKKLFIKGIMNLILYLR